MKITPLHNKQNNLDTVLFTFFAIKFNLPRIVLTAYVQYSVSENFKTI